MAFEVETHFIRRYIPPHSEFDLIEVERNDFAPFWVCTAAGDRYESVIYEYGERWKLELLYCANIDFCIYAFAFPINCIKFIREFVLAAMSLCRFNVCNVCSFKVCKRFLLHREIVDDKCPNCEARCWYWIPVFQTFENRDCYVQFCNSCRKILCTYTIDSIWGLCPWSRSYDEWVIIHPEFFQ